MFYPRIGSVNGLEKRFVLLERVAAKLCLHGPAFTDSDVDAAITLALVGLIHTAA